MPDSETPALDWIVACLRWLALLGMALALAARGPLPTILVLTLLATAVWGTLLATLAALKRSLPAQRWISLAGDMMFAYLLFFFSGGIRGGLGWAGLLPIIPAASYFQMRGVLAVSLVNIAAQGLLALASAPLLPVLITLGTILLLYLGVGFALSLAERRMSDLLLTSNKDDQTVQRGAEKNDRERRRAIYDLISALSATLNYQRVLDTALDISTSALTMQQEAADRLVGAALLFSSNENNQPELQIGSSRRFTPADMRLVLPGTNGLIGRAIDEGTPLLCKDVTRDPELSRIMALRSCKAVYCIPLRTGLNTYGVLLYGHPDGDYFTVDNREILDIAGNQVTIAIQNAQLYQDLEQEKERMMEIQEEARKKMARDLHDGPTQSVSAIAMRVNFARRLLERDPKATAEELYKIEDLARRTTKEIRHMLFTLRPLVLESQGLVAAFESMAEKMHETYNQDVIIQADPHLVDQLEISKQAVIFYIAEEAVNNARKHAQALHIWVRLKSIKEDMALLEIEDDGIGFNISEVDSAYENRGSLGMVNMRERTELVGGVLQIDSAVGRGARIQLIIPLTEEAGDRIRRGA